MRNWLKCSVVLLAACLLLCGISGCGSSSADTDTIEITNVSYDPTREFYTAYNEIFSAYWKEQTGQDVDIVQSHGGSGSQALSVVNGLEADVVTLALEQDIQSIADAGLIEDGFVDEFDNDSSPYTSTIVFLVRSGNEKNITDWDDLLQDGVDVITPNPKTSGGARWNYLAAWYYFETQGYDESEILEKMTTLYQNVLVLDSGARGATTTFVENGQGDVLIAWENEAYQVLDEYPGEYEIVVPSVSILCQPTVAVVDEVVDARGTRDLAEGYLSYLYSDDAQELIAQYYYRPYNQDIYEEYVSDEDSTTVTAIPEDGKWIEDSIEMITIDHFGGWAAATEKHFADGGLFDQIYEN